VELPFGIREFFHSFLIYHYLFFGILFLVAIFLLSLGVMLRKRLIFALFFYLLSFLSLSAGPVVGSYYLEEYLRKASLQNIKITRLVYTKAIIFTAELKNEGRIPFKKTNIVISIVKKDNNSILQFFNMFSPAQVCKTELRIPIESGNICDIRIVVDITKINAPLDYAVYYQVKSF
jgi:hypothetical protein